MILKEKMVTLFKTQFGTEPTAIVRAPGRVNLIGDHTDYNDGFVLPMAIDRAVWIALQPLPCPEVVLHSLEFGETVQFALTDWQHETAVWGDYVKGVAWALRQAGYALHGWQGVLASDVPIGAGLSSSAALELATARAFAAVADWTWQATPMALIGQQAENEWVGMNCGIMDQLISAEGVAGHALLIDCRSLALRSVPLPPKTAVVILDTVTRRGLVDSAYNERRQQCETAVGYFGVVALRDVTLAQLQAKATQLDKLVYRRARHVITENKRTVQAAKAMAQGDATWLGQLMSKSHMSLRDDFEVTNDGLNAIVACAQQQPGCYGARMTGGGFGGCAVALVQQKSVTDFVKTVYDCYQQQMMLEPQIYVCTPTQGAEQIL